MVFLTSLSMKSKKFFSRTISGPSWSRHLEGVRLSQPRQEAPDQFLLPMQTLAGPVDPAYKIIQWKGAVFPTLIFHHGHSEAAFDFSAQANNTFKNMFLWKQAPVEANWIVIRAPYHNDSLLHYLEHMVELSHYMAMLVGSVWTMEHVVQECRQKKNEKIYLAGVGMGGSAVNLHRTLYNSATAYIPLLAGAALAEVFVTGAYRRLTGSLALEYPDSVRQLLNFEEAFQGVKGTPVFPLLARFDRVINWERQKQGYMPESLQSIRKGHMTALMAPDLLRQHVLRAMQITAAA
jgi:hypothetical protein